jgi:hypothetical protein
VVWLFRVATVVALSCLAIRLFGGLSSGFQLRAVPADWQLCLLALSASVLVMFLASQVLRCTVHFGRCLCRTKTDRGEILGPFGASSLPIKLDLDDAKHIHYLQRGYIHLVKDSSRLTKDGLYGFAYPNQLLLLVDRASKLFNRCKAQP